MASDAKGSLIEKIYSSVNPSELAPKFYSAYKDILGLESQGSEGWLQEVGGGIAKGLASGYVDAYYDAYKKLPNEQEIQSYLSDKLNDKGVLAKGLQGSLTSQDMYNLAKSDPGFQDVGIKDQENQLVQSRGSFEEQSRQNVASQRTLLDQLAELQGKKAVESSNEQFGQSRGRMLSEMAASGRLFAPNAYQNVQKAEQAQQKNISDILGNIRASQIGQQLGAEQQGQQNIMQGRQFDVGTQQQNKQFGLDRQTLAEKIRQYNESLAAGQRESNLQRDLDDRLGRAQADANEPGTLDYINTGFQGLSALGGLASGIGAVGSAYNKYKANKTGTANKAGG